jgi:hypothetical protein
MAGAFMQLGQSAEAAAIYEKLVRTQPANVDFWRELIAARFDVSGANTALNLIQQIPAATPKNSPRVQTTSFCWLTFRWKLAVLRMRLKP